MKQFSHSSASSDPKLVISQLQNQILALKKEKMVADSLMSDLVREKQMYESMPVADQCVEEIFKNIADIKGMQEREMNALNEIGAQKDQVQKAIEQPQIADAMKYPLKAKICSLLNRDKPRKPK